MVQFILGGIVGIAAMGYYLKKKGGCDKGLEDVMKEFEEFIKEYQGEKI